MDFNLLNPSNYLGLLSEKKKKLENLFSEYHHPEIEVYSSPETYYRMRAEFRIWHDSDDLYYYMFDNLKKEKMRVDQFLPASKLINQMMSELLIYLKPNQVLRKKLFQVDFLSTLSGEILVTLLYHRALDSEWKFEAQNLKEQLSKKFNVNLIGRSRNLKIIIDQDYVTEELKVFDKIYSYKQIENSFTQPNASVAIKMLEWAKTVTKNSTGDLLELYCGNGNFSIALADNFRNVLATELAKPSVEAAQINIKNNGIKNLQIIRMSDEEFSEAMEFKREFTRLRGIDLKAYECHTILVDPPRSGLGLNTLKLVQKYNSILYISCNPHTLLSNIDFLSSTHQISKIALFDQFPYTEHIECGVLLTKK